MVKKCDVKQAIAALILGLAACSQALPDEENTPTGPHEYETEGVISRIVDAHSFYLGSILVIHDRSTRFEYGDATALAAGRRVEVEGTRDGFRLLAREIEFDDDYHGGEDDDDDYDESYDYEVEGTISSIVDGNSFYLGTLLVTHDNSTRFEHGNASRIAVGVRVEMEGTRRGFHLVARKIEFED